MIIHDEFLTHVFPAAPEHEIVCRHTRVRGQADDAKQQLISSSVKNISRCRREK
jgi:hypothetical protein